MRHCVRGPWSPFGGHFRIDKREITSGFGERWERPLKCFSAPAFWLYRKTTPSLQSCASTGPSCWLWEKTVQGSWIMWSSRAVSFGQVHLVITTTQFQRLNLVREIVNRAWRFTLTLSSKPAFLVPVKKRPFVSLTSYWSTCTVLVNNTRYAL